MDDFSIIARKNGIYIPNTFWGNIFFHWKWQTAEKAYSIFQEKYRQRESEWNNYREGLKISWGTCISGIFSNFQDADVIL